MTTRRVTIVRRTYLHLPNQESFRPALLDDPDVVVMQAREASPAFYRFLYGAVGRDHLWVDRLSWSYEELREHLSEPHVALLVLYLRGTPAGYLELDAGRRDGGTEVAYFGIMSAFQGRGLGKHLLSAGVVRAFEDGARWVWLHTCTLDGPHALSNYQARGFRAYRTETYEQALPAPE